ncbi:MAG: hypothetical protein JSU66_01795 [Deltaproteobacteria bacterium]|nr:MAG: hypothetical protein JSU66_01795 [Deltaproteobacteria bacterium]
MPVEKNSHKIRLTLSAQAERYARRDAPVGVRRMAARGALPLPPIELATVLFVLLHDPDTEVKTRARESLENLPDPIYTTVVSGRAHPAVLGHLAHVLKDRPKMLEPLALNAATDDETIAFLATLTHRRIVDIISNNQERMLRCPDIVEALGSNPLTSRSVIDRILSFLGLERPEAEAPEEVETDDALPPPVEVTDAQAEAALRAVLSNDASEFDAELIRENGEEISEEVQQSLFAQIQEMTVMQKVKLARMGNKEARGILVRDRNKVVASAAIRSPRINDNEVSQYAKMRNLSDEVVRIIAANREWTKSYAVKLALATNPRCPLSAAMKFLNHLQDRDLKSVMRSKDVPSPISTHARRILTKKGKI